MSHQLKSNPSSQKSVFIRSGCFFLFPKADCIIFAASLFWVIYSISVESDSFRLEPITFYFQSCAWYLVFAFYSKESSAMDHSTLTQSPFPSLLFGQLRICFSDAPGAEWMPRESIWKQVQISMARLLSFKSPTTVHLSPNPSSPFWSPHAPHDLHQNNLSFLRTHSSVSLLKAKSNVIHSWPMKANIPFCSMCLLGSFHKYLLAGKQKCKTCIHFCSRLKYTGNVSWAMAWAS